MATKKTRSAAEVQKYCASRIFKIRFIHLARRGISVRDLAERLDVSKDTLRSYSKKWKIKIMNGTTANMIARHNANPFGIKDRDVEDLGAEESADFGSTNE